MKKRIIFLLFIVLATIGSCAGSEETIRIGYLPVLVNLPLFVGIEEGFFEAHGLAVEAVEAQSPNHLVEAIINGQLDGAGVLAFPILFAAEEKAPGKLKIFSTVDETTEQYVAAIIVRNDSGIHSTDDLKRKRIGVYTGLVQVLFLKSILTGMGLDSEEVEIVQVTPRLQLQGLLAGQYDALSTVEPFVTLAKKQGIGRILIENPRTKYIQNPFPSVANPLSAGYVARHPGTAEKFLLGYQDAIAFINTHPEDAKVHLAKYTPITAEIAQEVTLPKFNQFGEENRENIQKYADWMVGNDLLEKKVVVDSMFGTFG